MAYLCQFASIVVGLSATVDANSPMEAYGILRAVDPAYAGTLEQFLTNYINYYRDPMGKIRIVQRSPIKNQSYYDYIFQRIYYSHTIEGMPNVTFVDKYCTPTPGQLLLLDAIDAQRDNPLTSSLGKIARSQIVIDYPRAVGLDEDSPKLQLCLSIIHERPQSSFVIFSPYLEVLHWLLQILPTYGYRTGIIDGSVSSKNRFSVSQSFNNHELDVLLLSPAGGDSINCYCDSFIFWTLPYSGIQVRQGLGRCLRLDSPHRNILCHFLICGSPDAKRMATIATKQANENSTEAHAQLAFGTP
ncbi:hypothetical protein AGMMS49991_11940 [Spirochaetia bacterium]|nr:hypothetical protein AGMMS49991_11940 [Spirochaetia bacterium]